MFLKCYHDQCYYIYLFGCDFPDLPIVRIGRVWSTTLLQLKQIVIKNAILDGCSNVDSTLDYDGIGWYSMVLHGILCFFAIE